MLRSVVRVLAVLAAPLLCACGSSGPPAADPASDATEEQEPTPPSDEPAPPPVEPVQSAADLQAMFQRLAARPLALGFERGACRKGVIRVDGDPVAHGSDPAHPQEQAALIEALVSWEGSGETPGLDPVHAAIVAGVLWDARVALPRRAADPLGRLLVRLHDDPPATEALRCRKLKAVQEDGPLWNARGDVLALLARVHDGDTPRPAPGPDGVDYPRTAGRQALDAAMADVPALDPVGPAAFGDPDAIHAVTKDALADLCTERTWKTTWMLRAIDTGKKQASLLPMGQLQTGACELLEQGADPDVVTPRQD